MNETHATKYLLGLPTVPPHGTAKREGRLLAALGEPERNLFIIKILGEAGKSSASSLVCALLSHGGIPNGSVTLTPTSEPRLAIRIDGEPPSHKEFAEAVTLAWSAVREADMADPSYEEMLLAAALMLFVKCGCRVATVELCADSRLSATQALASPRLCLLTSTSAARAEELVSLLDTKHDMVSAPQEPSVYRLLTERAAAAHCRLSFPTKNEIGETTFHGASQAFTYQGKSYSLPTLAHYQKNNALAVIEAYRALLRQGFRLSEQDLLAALSELSTPLNFRFFSLSPAWLIDCADSPMRLSALADSVARLPSLFPEKLTIWTEPKLEGACREAFGEKIAHLEILETATLSRTLKKQKPPTDSPLLAIGSEPFASEILRALNDLFLFQ